MKLVYLLLSVILLFSVANAQSNPLIQAIYGQVGNLDPEQKATSTSPYVYDINSIGFSHFVQSTVANLVSSLQPFNLPSNVISQIQSIVYMQQTNFMGFNFVVQNDQATLTQYAGCARNVQGTVQVACITSETHGALVQQYSTTTEPVKTCKFCTDISKGFRCCTTTIQTIKTAVGFTTDQLEDIENALAKAGMAYISNQLANPPADFKNYNNLGVVDSQLTMLEEEYIDPMIELVDILVQTIEQLEDYIKKETPIILNNSTNNNETEQNTTTLLKTIFGQGYQSFQQSAVSQKFQGVYPQYTQQFLNLMLQQLNIPSQYLKELNNMMNTVLKSNLDKWVIFSVLFSQNESSSSDNNSTEPMTKYVCLIGRKNSTNQQTDWVSANIDQTFTLQPDILVMRHCYYDEEGDNICSTSNVEKARALTPEEEEDLFDFFEVVAFKTIVKTLQSGFVGLTQQ